MYGNSKNWPFFFSLSVVSILFILLGAKLIYLQIIKGEYYRGLSSQNHIRVIVTPAPRGVISDRNGIILADSKPAFIVSAVPSEFNRANAALVEQQLEMTEGELNEILDEASNVPHRPVVLREGLGVEKVSSIAENLYRIPGVVIDVAPLRRYHRPEDFCHILGYVGLADDQNSFRGEITGRTGLELRLNETLRGIPGLQREVVDALGRIVEEFRGASSEDPVPGGNVTLTIDAGLQRIAITELEQTGIPGAVVVIDYENGDILCAASIPTFDPNMFARGITQDEWTAILDNQYNPLFERAWAAAYPPASTFKVITACWLLSEGLISPDYMPNPCYGSLTLGDTEFGCWAAHGRLNVVQALEQSCDVFFYRTVQLGTINELAEYTACFGMGSRLTDVLIGEKSGLIPDSDYLNRAYGNDGWGLGNLLNISIGQGELLATPLQLAVTAGIIASRGEMPFPGILLQRKIMNPVLSHGAVTDSAFDTVTEGMLRVVTSRRGTLYNTFSDSSLDFWGKTGTAECPGEDHALVIGFVRDPMPLAICVVIEHGGHGGAVAGPVAERILSSYFAEEGSD